MASTGSIRERRTRSLLPLRQSRSNRHLHQQHQLLLPQQPRASSSEPRRDRQSISRQRHASRSSMPASHPLLPEDGEMVEEMMPLQRVGVAILGARGVGKTSLVCQFVYHELQPPDVERRSTGNRGHSNRRQRYHHVPVVVDNRLYDLRLTDCPPISHFPSSSLQEWADYRGYGLRHAAAYVLVYDVSDDDSFSYVKSMREQILTHRGAHSQHDVPIVVAANKADLQAGSTSVSAAWSRSRDTAANVVRKQWKCSYVECSARYNWRVVALFRELMKAVDHSVRQRGQRAALTGGASESAPHIGGVNPAGTSTSRLQEALQRNHCVIL